MWTQKNRRGVEKREKIKREPKGEKISIILSFLRNSQRTPILITKSEKLAYKESVLGV